MRGAAVAVAPRTLLYRTARFKLGGGGEKGKRAVCHPLEGDVIVNRGYVIDKYKKDNDYFVDLVWWFETTGNVIVEEGFATVSVSHGQDKSGNNFHSTGERI
jgi:hypothetical protein